MLGGERRRDSVAAGLEALDDCAWALVHDAARPFLSVAVIARGLDEVTEGGRLRGRAAGPRHDQARGPGPDGARDAASGGALDGSDAAVSGATWC